MPFSRRLSTTEQLRRLQSVTDAALGHLSFDSLAEEILVRIRDALEADTCAILLLDEERNELVARAAKGIEEEVEQGVRIPVGKGFAGRIAAERRPVYLPDVDHADIMNPILREKRIKSMLGAPLLTRGRVLGVVHVGTLTPRRFGASEVELLQVVADRVAVALERVLIHDEVLALDAMKRDFVSTAAHELRTPVSVIYGVAETLRQRRDALDAEKIAGLVDSFYDATVRLAQLTEDLLDISRLDAGTAPLAREHVSVRETVDKLGAELSSLRDAPIENTVADDTVAFVDRAALERILGNLLKNAVVHGEPPVRVSARRDNGRMAIEVEDRGAGVPDSLVPRVFEAFARLDHDRPTPGVGLGLAIARSYAHRLGGDLLYEHVEPHGAKFTLMLPEASQ
jgi:signal transduction histidine kinase